MKLCIETYENGKAELQPIMVRSLWPAGRSILLLQACGVYIHKARLTFTHGSTGTWWAPQGPRSGKVYLTFWHVITLVSAELGVWVIEAMSHESFRWCNRLRHWEISRTTLHSMKQCSMLSKSSDLRSLVSQTSVVAAIWTFCSRNTVFIKAFNRDIESGWQNMVSVLINVPCKATFVLQ